MSVDKALDDDDDDDRDRFMPAAATARITIGTRGNAISGQTVLWDVLGRHVQRQAPHNQRQLRDALQRTWNAIPMETIQHLVRSMPNRLQECARAMGGHTRY